MCSVDWTALGTWVQAAFIAGGTVFAAVQYLTYRNNARLDRTLEIMSRFDMLRHVGVSGIELSAALAIPFVQEAASSLSRFKIGFGDYMRGEAATDNAKWYLRASDASVIVLNYFTDAARLAEKGLIDLDMFFDARSYLATIGIPPALTLVEAELRHYNFGALKGFLDQAQDYLSNNPVT
jgi:hypothetical protein